MASFMVNDGSFPKTVILERISDILPDLDEMGSEAFRLVTLDLTRHGLNMAWAPMD